MNNSIRLKELQIVSGTLRKGDEELGFIYLFSKEFFWVRVGSGNSTAFQKNIFG